MNGEPTQQTVELCPDTLETGERTSATEPLAPPRLSHCAIV